MRVATYMEVVAGLPSIVDSPTTASANRSPECETSGYGLGAISPLMTPGNIAYLTYPDSAGQLAW